MNELKSFIRNLELSEGDSSWKFRPIIDDGADILEATDADEGILNFKSLCSFVAGVSRQRQEDVLNSLLLAQRVASRNFPEDGQIVDWYKKYFEILDKIGWVFENKDFLTFTSRSSLFEVEKAILEILGAALTGNQLVIISKTLAALKALGEDDKRFLAFEKNTHSMQKGSFQLGVAVEENDTISLSMSAFILNSSKKITKILFFNSAKADSELIYNHTKATLNESIFKDARGPVKEKLGDVSDFVARLEL